ncbi:MAG: hypothetical protein KDE25_06080 [Novosphingobium sp.]|nr:hypothetical protein [Novosphingobium sp.]
MSDTKSPKWYDSVWLGRYFAAQDILRREAPDRLEEFEQAMRVFRCPADYRVKVARGLFDDERLGQVKEIIRSIPRDVYWLDEVQQFGRLVVRDWPQFHALQETLVDVVSEMAGEPVEPSANFLSLYTHRGVCEPHLDAPSAKWTLDLCIDQSEPWPIHFSQIVDWPGPEFDPGEDWREEIKQDPALRFRSEVLMPGDALLFTGPNQWHYRDAISLAGGKPHCDLLFLHFVPVGTTELAQPENWARIFDLPQLGSLGIPPRVRLNRL